MPMLEEFSAGYWLAPSMEAVTYNGNRAVVQDDVFVAMAGESGQDPLLTMVAGMTYELHPVRDIPSNVVAIPARGETPVHDGDAVLISKRNGGAVFADE